ncbi:MAG TPA: ATP phosphoribosyltransferase regulatory subunit, partial [bacterium]|nr:ATP phosphoribosyltransferase regulatory subunit [bacterium]
MADNSKFVPPKGMRDWLPQETLLRQKLIRLIESHYQLYGFQPIDTPVMENIEVLQGKGGGENEKLMFKVMKRGEDLDREIDSLSTEEKIEIWLKFLNGSSFEDDDDSKHKWIKPAVLRAAVRKMKEEFSKLSSFDMGLRFDMTVPLARYYGNHANDLPKPFRCYHIGPVWRA